MSGCVYVLCRAGVSDRDGPSQGTDGDNNRRETERGERNEEGEEEEGLLWTLCLTEGFKSNIWQSVSGCTVRRYLEVKRGGESEDRGRKRGL